MKFREIAISENQFEAVNECLRTGQLTTGPLIEAVEKKMAAICNSEFSIAISSGTMALKIALHAQGIGKGSRVIIPEVTFVACRGVINELGASPVFCDIDPETFLLEESCCRDLVKEGKIDAIMAVRLGGEPLPDWIFELGVPVIIDSAHSMDPHDERAFATCYSFHPSKIVSGIEGGCILTDREYIYNEAIELRSFGFTKGTRIASRDGYKANMTNVSAAVIIGNLNQLIENLRERKRVRDQYNLNLDLKKQGLGMYMVLVDDPDEVCRQIPAIRHYPMPLSEMIFGKSVSQPGASYVCKHLVSLPFHEYLSTVEIFQVCDILKSRLIKTKATFKGTMK